MPYVLEQPAGQPQTRTLGGGSSYGGGSGGGSFWDALFGGMGGSQQNMPSNWGYLDSAPKYQGQDPAYKLQGFNPISTTTTPHYPGQSAGQTQAYGNDQIKRDNAQESQGYLRGIGAISAAPDRLTGQVNVPDGYVRANVNGIDVVIPDPYPGGNGGAGGGAGSAGGANGNIATTADASRQIYDRGATQRAVNAMAGKAVEQTDPRHLMHTSGVQRPGMSLDQGSLAQVSPQIAQGQAAIGQALGVIPFMDELANRNYQLGGQSLQANESNALAQLLAGRQDLNDYRSLSQYDQTASMLNPLLQLLQGMQ